MILEKNNMPVELYHDYGDRPFVFSENGDYLYRFSVVNHKFSLSFTHGLMDAVGAFSYMKAVLKRYYQMFEGKSEQQKNQSISFRSR